MNFPLTNIKTRTEHERRLLFMKLQLGYTDDCEAGIAQIKTTNVWAQCAIDAGQRQLLCAAPAQFVHKLNGV